MPRLQLTSASELTTLPSQQAREIFQTGKLIEKTNSK